jgi:hypothetical protein
VRSFSLAPVGYPCIFPPRRVVERCGVEQLAERDAGDAQF